MTKKFKKLTQQEILKQKPSVDEVKELKRMPVCLVVDNVRSLYNVGSFFRTADAILLEKIYLCGISACPPNKQIEKVALGATEVVPFEYFESVHDCLKSLKRRNYKIFGIELTHESKTFYNAKFEGPLAMVVGNEVDGLSDGIEELLDEAVDIPMLGRANSLNVATAFAVVAYEVYKQMHG